MKVRANGIDIEVEDTRVGRATVLLVMGLGMQLIAWPERFVQALVDAGFRVVGFDNRDVGLSHRFENLGVPNLMWEGMKRRIGLPVRAPYTLQDMANDSLGVLDALGIEKAHVVGMSMGGMIAQRLAVAAPARVMSLTSIMSSSGARRLPGPKPQVLKLLLSRPQGSGEEALVEHYVKLLRAIGSPGFPIEDAELRQRIVAGLRRSHYPAGTLRQMVAVTADSRRAKQLPGIAAPTLVIHGRDDPLVPFACGQDTARRIPNAQFVAVHGMGHDLAPGVVDQILRPLVAHLQRNT